MNVVNVHGTTYIDGEQSSLVNITLIAIYPKAAVEAYSDIFAVNLFFLVSLDSNITEFICYDIEVDFRSVNWTYLYYGRETLDVQSGTLVDFHRVDNTGSIAPFFCECFYEYRLCTVAAFSSRHFTPHILNRPN